MLKKSIPYSIKAVNAIKNNCSIRAALMEMGRNVIGSGQYKRVKEFVLKYAIDTSHWMGQASTKGRKYGSKFPVEDYLSNRIKVNSHGLKKRLIAEGLKEAKCENCGITQWREMTLSFELHHVDGNPRNNNFSNLKILCPNCHSQTPNHRGRGIKAVVTSRVSEEEIVAASNGARTVTDILRKVGLSIYGKNPQRIKEILFKNGIELVPKFMPLHKGNPNWRTEPKPHLRKVERPTKEELEFLVSSMSFLAIARKFKVKSDNTIRKWCQIYEIDFKKLSPYSHK